MRLALLALAVASALSPYLVACPPQIQDVANAVRHLKHLHHQKMKSDANGHVWYLDISEQDSVSDLTLASIGYLPHLREIYMIFCPVKGDGLEHVARLKHLEKLDLYGTQVNDDALAHIAKVPTLKYLDIRSIEVNDEGVIKNEHGAISDVGIKLLADNLPNLESLLFAGMVTDDGLRNLAKFKKLRYVEISSPRVTLAGIEWLSNAMPKLEIDN